jgi:hypothetical protein
MVPHTPYSYDVAFADFSLFPMLNRKLVGLTFCPDEFKRKWERVVKGCHTFNTPAPLLQELGLNNLTTHTASCITESYTHGKPYSQS